MTQHSFGPLPFALACATLLGAAGAATGQTITYEPIAGVPTFAVREPVLRLKPGATVDPRYLAPEEDAGEEERPHPFAALKRLKQ